MRKQPQTTQYISLQVGWESNQPRRIISSFSVGLILGISTSSTKKVCSHLQTFYRLKGSHYTPLILILMFLGPRLFKESQCILPFSVSLAGFHRPTEAENVRIYCRLFHAVKHPHCTRPCTTPGSIIDACLSDIWNFQARPSSKVSPPKTNGRIFVG